MTPLRRTLAWLALAPCLALLGSACGSSGTSTVPAPGPEVVDHPPSAAERAVPYVGDPAAFWQRADLYVMDPELEPLDRWPDEVLFPATHGIRVIVLLPGDYRGRSNGALGDGTLYIEDSGTAAEPLLVTYASHVGADILAEPHPAERRAVSEARLSSIRVWNQTHQYFHGLTFRDGIASSLLRETSGTVIDRCLWHETTFQPLRIRFGAHHNVIQRCVMQRFDKASWTSGDTVAIQLSDGACTHNEILSNVILNYTDAYQHTDRDGEPYGLGAGTLVDSNIMGFTPEAYVQEDAGELMCGENTIDLKMGGTEFEPVRVTNNVFFGVRAALAGCAASGSGGYAVTCHRRGTWVEFTGNVFLDMDSGIFLNAYFQDVDPAQGRIDPHLTITDNLFTGIRSFATAFPARTGRVMSGTSPATFRLNRLVGCERLMEQEPVGGTGPLVIEANDIHGPLDLAPRSQAELEADGNTFHAASSLPETVLRIPWVGRTIRFQSAP